MSRSSENTVVLLDPWSRVIEPSELGGETRDSYIIVVKIPWFHRLLVKLLGFKTLGSTKRGIAIGYKGNPNSENTLEIEITSEKLYKLYSTKLPRLIALPLSEPLRFLSFTAVGASGILVNLLAAQATYNILESRLGPLVNTVASATGFETSVLSNFTLNELVTFRGVKLSRSLRDIVERLLKYHAASIGSLLCQVSMANLLPRLLGAPFWLSQLTGVVLGFIVNFILGYIYTWSIHRLG